MQDKIITNKTDIHAEIFLKKALRAKQRFFKKKIKVSANVFLKKHRLWVFQTSPISWKFNNIVANFICVSYYSKKQIIKTETRKTEISEKKTAVEKKRKIKKRN